MDATEARVFAIMFGVVVERLRRQQQRSQDEVASCCGISQSTLSRVESGELKLPSSAVGPLAEALHVPIGELYRGVETIGGRALKAARAAWHAEASLPDVVDRLGVHAFHGLILFASAMPPT